MQHFAFYNAERPHQALGYETPDRVYRSEVGGGALIVDTFGDDDGKQKSAEMTGHRRAAVDLEMGTT